MKRLFLLIAVAMMSVCTMNAQSKLKYHGEVDLGYSIGVGTFSTGRLNLQTIQGVKIGEHFSTGVGLGFDLYTNLTDGAELIMPVTLNLKGYLPVSAKADMFASFDIGAGVGVTSGVSGLSGFTCTPAIGINAGKFKAQLGYNIQQLSESGIGINMNAIQIKLGIML